MCLWDIGLALRYDVLKSQRHHLFRLLPGIKSSHTWYVGLVSRFDVVYRVCRGTSVVYRMCTELVDMSLGLVSYRKVSKTWYMGLKNGWYLDRST